MSRLEIGELAALGHELRTPLSVINGYAQLLRSDELTVEQRARCDLILEECEEMNLLILGFLESRESRLTPPVAVDQTCPG